ncbi:MAG: hypothetical protein CSA11_04420 [Chloroflexi bacterium]|nr:MAG: hypothetical protein CSA11_04420 [Chloroflexota bacterium]
MPTARFVLRWLVEESQGERGERKAAGVGSWEKQKIQQLAEWLIEQGLGALAYGRCAESELALRRCLQGDMFSAAAESSMKQEQLKQILQGLAQAEIPVVLLKGAALSLTVYEDPAWRTMSDVDLWLPANAMAKAAQVMVDLGYTMQGKEERPFALQQLSRGEIQWVLPQQMESLIEFHWSPYSGWWLVRTAAVNDTGIWTRQENLPEQTNVGQMAPEDIVIHLAVHTAVNHQFGLSALRSLVDIALTANKREVDWNIVAKRARAWRVSIAVYIVLDLLAQLIGVEGIETSLTPLRPSKLRRWLISQFVTPQTVLAGRDLRSGAKRFLLLLLLVDRVRDMVKLIGRTLWPEQEWLEARYGGSVKHWGHLRQIIMTREV